MAQSTKKNSAQRWTGNASIQPRFCDCESQEVVTNFCAWVECLKVLCPECIPQHYEFHRAQNINPQIHSIKNTKINCERKIQTAIKDLEKELEQGDIQYILNPKVQFEKELKKLDDCKQQMMKIIEMFFQQQSDLLKQSIEENMLKVKDIGGVCNEIKNLIGQLEGLLGQINTNSDPYPYISKACRLDVKSMTDKYKSAIKKVIQTHDLDPITVHIDEHRLFQLKAELMKIVKVVTNLEQEIEYEQEQLIMPNQEQNSQNMLHGIDQSQEFPRTVPQGQAHTQQQAIQPYQPQQQDNSSTFQITMPDYFDKTCPTPQLHFFKNADKILYLLNLNEKLKFKQVKLNIDYLIPFFHRSITLPNGEIYVSGGTNQETGQKDCLIKNYNTGNNSLENLAVMSVGRSSHNMVYCNGYIYIIGGFIMNSVLTSSMERYNVLEQHFEQCADAQYPANSPTCCVFANKFIFKFGGNQQDGNLIQVIERYSIDRNKWDVIDPQLGQYEIDRFEGIFQYAACVQINANDIFVFGGYDQENKGFSFSYLLNGKDEENQITGTNQKPLPTAEGFWNNQVIIHNKKLFVLQNIEIEGESIDETRRKILCFDGNKWLDLGNGQ